MILGRTSKLTAGCTNCHTAVLKSFIDFAGLNSRPRVTPRITTPWPTNPAVKRCLITSRTRQSDVVQQERSRGTESSIEEALSAQPATEAEDDVVSPIPWYLQVESPERASNPILKRQEIPELPSDPPPLLKPMLEHISIDIGLDDLMIFDLRKLDPPPALGANLLMILGTARSEKHLHISADRFCRWLKVTHKLSPYADGLLGRGELKLKLRRKARRAKLLSNVGSSETKNVDDGLRTGWICVNVGTIEEGVDASESNAQPDDYVGFGSEAEGVKVVIQMLTQEKREELDLEDLWGKMLRRQEKKDERISTGAAAIKEVGHNSQDAEKPISDLQSLTSSSHPKPPTIDLHQRR